MQHLVADAHFKSAASSRHICMGHYITITLGGWANSHVTRDVHPLLAWLWASVRDVVTAFAPHCQLAGTWQARRVTGKAPPSV